MPKRNKNGEDWREMKVCPECVQKISSLSKQELKGMALLILDYMNDFIKRSGKRGFREVTVNLDPIEQRLKSGVTVDDCKRVVAHMWGRWKGTEHEKHFRPITIFSASKFEQYLGETPMPVAPKFSPTQAPVSLFNQPKEAEPVEEQEEEKLEPFKLSEVLAQVMSASKMPEKKVVGGDEMSEMEIAERKALLRKQMEQLSAHPAKPPERIGG